MNIVRYVILLDTLLPWLAVLLTWFDLDAHVAAVAADVADVWFAPW
jgi:hypothetical protein